MTMDEQRRLEAHVSNCDECGRAIVNRQLCPIAVSMIYDDVPKLSPADADKVKRLQAADDVQARAEERHPEYFRGSRTNPFFTERPNER